LHILIWGEIVLIGWKYYYYKGRYWQIQEMKLHGNCEITDYTAKNEENARREANETLACLGKMKIHSNVPSTHKFVLRPSLILFMTK
jgi:hypothetical protein